jgi:hypothetical protein
MAMVGLACPLLLVAVALLLRLGAFTFRDDFTGFQALGFLLTWVVVLAPLGLITSAWALWLDRRGTLARIALGVNAVICGGALLLLASLSF